jgi:hypothetical protein
MSFFCGRVLYRKGVHGEGTSEGNGQRQKMMEGGWFWAERTKGEALKEEARQARAGVEDALDVADLGGRARDDASRKATAPTR